MSRSQNNSVQPPLKKKTKELTDPKRAPAFAVATLTYLLNGLSAFFFFVLFCFFIERETTSEQRLEEFCNRKAPNMIIDLGFIFFVFLIYFLSALQDYESALKLDPKNVDLKNDSERIRRIIQGST